MYKACIFDLDGTLTNTLESISHSVNLTLQAMGMEQITDAQCKSFVGNGIYSLMQKSLQAVGDTDLVRMDEAMNLFKGIYKDNATYHVQPYEGICDLLRKLHERGIRLAVLSNKPHVMTQDVVTSLLGENIFQCVYGQRDGFPRKPDPAAVYDILDALGVSKDECLFIGDSEVDMQTGCAAGVHTVGVTWGFRTRDVLVQSGATYLVNKPEEIISIVKE